MSAKKQENTGDENRVWGREKNFNCTLTLELHNKHSKEITLGIIQEFSCDSSPYLVVNLSAFYD